MLSGHGRDVGSNPTVYINTVKALLNSGASLLKRGFNMISLFNIFRLIALISSLVFMISSIRAKKRKSLETIKYCSIGNMVYLVADIFVFPNVFDLYVGLEVIVYVIAAAIAGLFTIIGLIVNIVRAKKLVIVGHQRAPRWPILYLIPALLLVTCVVYEYVTLQNANLILVHEPAGFSSDYYHVAVTDDYSAKLDLGERFFKSNAQECDYYEYDIIRSGADTYDMQSYHDPEFKEIDREIVEKIYQFKDFKRNEGSRELYGDDVCFKGSIKKIVGTDYYIVSWLMSTNSELGGGGTVYGEAIFLNDQFVDDIQIGNIDKILFYK